MACTMKELIYFHPDLNWAHFKYKTGVNKPSYKNKEWETRGTWMKAGTKEEQILSEKKKAAERAAELRKKKVDEKKLKPFSESIWSPSELMYLTEGKITGTFPINGRLPDKKKYEELRNEANSKKAKKRPHHKE